MSLIHETKNNFLHRAWSGGTMVYDAGLHVYEIGAINQQASGPEDPCSERPNVLSDRRLEFHTRAVQWH